MYSLCICVLFMCVNSFITGVYNRNQCITNSATRIHYAQTQSPPSWGARGRARGGTLAQRRRVILINCSKLVAKVSRTKQSLSNSLTMMPKVTIKARRSKRTKRIKKISIRKTKKAKRAIGTNNKSIYRISLVVTLQL